MGTENQKLKFIVFGLGNGDSPDDIDATFQCQVKNWQIVNNTEDGAKQFAFCYDPAASDAENLLDGEFREEAEPDYSLVLELFADWRSNGISDYLWLHDGETLSWRIEHMPHLADRHVQWSGDVKIKAPSVGGEARTTEMTSVTLPIIGKPDYARVSESV